MTHIISFKWGQIVTKDHRGRTDIWKDCVISDDGPENWNWRHDGTRHVPGVTVAALRRLKKCTHIIVSTGIDEKLQVTPEARQLLENWKHEHDVQYWIQNSKRAYITYNRIVQQAEQSPDEAIVPGLLLHSTC